MRDRVEDDNTLQISQKFIGITTNDILVSC